MFDTLALFAAVALAHQPVLLCDAPSGGVACMHLSADAQRLRSRIVSVQGTGGRGATLHRTAIRQRGSVSVDRGIQTNGGRGADTQRNASWSNGSYTGNKTTTTDSGATFGRTTTATANGNGSATGSTTFTGPKGNTKTVGGTVTVSH